MKNYFITLEGIEGAGKSTAMEFIKKLLLEKKIKFITTREPGGTVISEAIRQLLLTPSATKISVATEILLMFASRAQHIAEVIKPALARGEWVICDRFTDATYAYQGGGRKFDFDKIKILEQWVQDSLQPDLTILLDIPVDVGMTRIKARNNHRDRFEQEKTDFFERVRQAYLRRAKQDANRFKIIQADQSLANVELQLTKMFEKL